MGSFTGDTSAKSKEKRGKRKELPGRLCDTGNETFARKLPEANAADAEEADESMPATTERAAVVDTGGVLRLFAQLMSAGALQVFLLPTEDECVAGHGSFEE